MGKVNWLGILLLLIGLATACTPPSSEVEEIYLDVSDPALQRIQDFQNQQATDSLLKYLESGSANLRYHSALAFASIQDSTMLNPLSAYLNDPHPKVRAATAFAVGQSGAASAAGLLIDAFNAYDTAGIYAEANSTILEAVGKCGDPEVLDQLSSISTYRRSDTLLLLGQLRGIYQFALRGINSPAGTEKMLDIVADESYPANLRLIAANYFYRSRNLDLSNYAETFGQLIFREKDPRIRMALVIALGKTTQPEALAALQQRFKMENDYRVRCNILRALGNFPFAETAETVLAAIKDENIHVANTAAAVCLEHGTRDTAAEFWKLAKDSVPASTVPVLYQALQRHLPYALVQYRQGLNGEIKRRYRETEDPYLQAGYLEALAEFGWNFRFIKNEGFVHPSPIVRSKSVSLLGKILDRPDFRTFFGVSYRNVRQEIALGLKEAIRSNDIGMINPAATALQEIGRGPQEYLIKMDSSFLLDALIQLELPKDYETYEVLRETAREFRLENIPTEAVRPQVRPIDWELLQGLSKQPIAQITTTQGDLSLVLSPEIAPATVANFVRLAQEDFFDGLYFHRVVPNFVVQSGCDRGDGQGGANTRIRSELKPVSYDRSGIMGMARSDLHSESSQFFITHSPTLHLDGKYTVFGSLQEGQDVLDRIVQGDQILDITIK